MQVDRGHFYLWISSIRGFWVCSCNLPLRVALYMSVREGVTFVSIVGKACVRIEREGESVRWPFELLCAWFSEPAPRKKHGADVEQDRRVVQHKDPCWVPRGSALFLYCDCWHRGRVSSQLVHNVRHSSRYLIRYTEGLIIRNTRTHSKKNAHKKQQQQQTSAEREREIYNMGYIIEWRRKHKSALPIVNMTTIQIRAHTHTNKIQSAERYTGVREKKKNKNKVGAYTEKNKEKR